MHRVNGAFAHDPATSGGRWSQNWKTRNDSAKAGTHDMECSRF